MSELAGRARQLRGQDGGCRYTSPIQSLQCGEMTGFEAADLSVNSGNGLPFDHRLFRADVWRQSGR